MRNLKKVLALVLVLALSLTMFAGAAQIETVFPFGDVEELTAEQLDALKLLYALQVIKGNDQNKSDPNGTYTRAELAATLYRLYTGDAEEKYVSTYSHSSPYFADASGAWYTPYVNWAYLKGVILGYGDGNFGPNDPVTGVQAATMLARLLGYEVEGENWDITARKIAIENRLDAGVESKDLFNTNLTRGDMFVMVANTLNSCEIGSKITLAEKIFDLEIINGAILVGFQKLGREPFTVFAFKDLIGGDVRYFTTDLISVDQDSDIKPDEVGERYTLYVAKTKEIDGYKYLYAAYEEDRENNPYYTVVEGTVDDGALIMDTTKAGCLLNKLEDFCIAYINGVPTKMNKAEAFEAFKAAYGIKNGAAYKLIDNNGNGKYEYIIIYKWTLADVSLSTLIANVVSYDRDKGAYILSDGNAYYPGQYWDVDAKGNIVASIVDVAPILEKAIGINNNAPSPVQYKFTVCGKYIMKVEVTDTTKFAGNYVLGLEVIGSSTYKGMNYVKFLTEDNTDLYAYVSKINNLDPKNAARWNDNNPITAAFYTEKLFYVNAYGDDTVEVYTVDYMNSNFMGQDYVNGYMPEVRSATRKAGFDLIAAKAPTLYVDSATLPYLSRANGYEYWYVDIAPVGYNGNDLYYKTNDGKLVALPASGVPAEATDKNIYTATQMYYFSEALRKAFYNGNYTDAKCLAYANVNDAVAQTKIDVEVKFEYQRDRLQIFRAYDQWYMQEYGTANIDPASVQVFFNGLEVVWDAVHHTWCVKDNLPAKIAYNTGEADPDAIYWSIFGNGTTIVGVLNQFANSTFTPAYGGTLYGAAEKLEYSLGVIFAFGSVANTWSYKWKAYNLDEFKVKNFGVGGPNDDRDPFTIDEAVITTINGVKYIKAAKVTVSGNDALPLTTILGTGDMYIFANAYDTGIVTTTYQTIRTHLPNGKADTVNIPFGMAEFFMDGTIFFAKKDASGNVIDVEYYCNILDFVIQNEKYGNGKVGNVIDANGVMTVATEYPGINTTISLNLDKTFFCVLYKLSDANYKVCNAADFAKAVKDTGFQFRYWTIGEYTFVLAASNADFTTGGNKWNTVNP